MKDTETDNNSTVGTLYLKYKNRLLSYFLKLTNGDQEISQDLIQIVFCKIIEHREEYRGAGSFESWLFTIARNCGRDYFRKKNVVKWVDEGNVAFLPDDTFDNISRQEQYQQVYLAISRLKARDKEIIALAMFKGLQYSVIAGILGISEGAVKNRVSRSIERFKVEYQKFE